MSLPKVAVVIPVKDDPTGIDEALRRIAAQDYPADRLLVLVTVDGGDAATVAAARNHAVRVISQVPAAGSYAARNRALDEIPDDVDVVVFTDADCLPVPGWITAHVAALADADMSGGAVKVTLSPQPHPAEFVDSIRHLQQRTYVTRQHYAATANLAVRRDVLREMRFDASLKTGGDVEFGRRATAAGLRLVYNEDARVDHPARRDTAELFTKIDRICTGMAARPDYWRGRVVSPARLRRELARRAIQGGINRSPLWLLRVVLLEWRCQRRVVRSAVAAGAVVAPRRPVTVGYVVDRPAELTQTFVTREIEELRRQGLRVVIIAARPARNAPPPQVPTLVVKGLAAGRWRLRAARGWHRLAHPRRWADHARALDDLSSEFGPDRLPTHSLPYVAGWLRRHHVDVLHAHFAWNAAALALPLARLTGLPWALTVHAKDIFSDRRNLDVKLSSADRLVTVCDYNRRFLQEELGVTRPVDLVVCGVDVPTASTPRSIEHDVVAVGRLVEKKGFDVLLDAAAKLRTQRPDLRVRIVGDGPLLTDLRAQADRLGIDDAVEFTGPRSHDDTLTDIAAARLLCLPARIDRDGDRDSMPVVVKEAMAAGVPVVVSDVAALTEMVDGEVGRVVPPDDPDRLAVALDEILELSEPDRVAMGRRGRARVVERFTTIDQVARLKDILTSIAEEHS